MAARPATWSLIRRRFGSSETAFTANSVTAGPAALRRLAEGAASSEARGAATAGVTASTATSPQRRVAVCGPASR